MGLSPILAIPQFSYRPQEDSEPTHVGESKDLLIGRTTEKEGNNMRRMCQKIEGVLACSIYLNFTLRVCFSCHEPQLT